MRRRLALALSVVAVAAIAGLSAGTAGAADECKGLRVCLPVTGPWVVVPAGGVDYELACPLAGYIVAGTDARAATSDVDVSFRGETGSPVGPGVTTLRSIVFHAARILPGAGTTSFRPFLGCIPSNGGGGRALTGVMERTGGIKPSTALFSVVVNARIHSGSQTVRAACPSRSRLVGATHAIAFRQAAAPSAAQRSAIRVMRTISRGVVVAHVTRTGAAGSGAELQLRAVCARVQ